MPREGPAQLELSDVAVGVYNARLVAWAPDASAVPVAVELGTFTIQTLDRRDGTDNPAA